MAIALVLASCAGHGREGDTNPTSLPDAASLIPVAPAPQPTPTPTPQTPSDDPLPGTPPGGGDDTSTGSCGEPVPPPLSRIKVVVYSSQGDHVRLDSTPLVHGIEYCAEIGYTDGRAYCPVRPDGHPERLACEAARVGRATDTRRVGPTWTANGQLCEASSAPGSCTNHATNQFQVHAYQPGTFRACAESDVCGQITIE